MNKIVKAIGRTKWLRHDIREFIAKVLANEKTIKPKYFEAPYFETTFQGDLASHIDYHIFFFGAYEHKEVALIRDILERLNAPVVFDIGGNVGAHALAMAALAEEIHTFEPYPPLADRLASQCDRKEIDNVHLHRFGLGERDETRPYYLNVDSRNVGTGSFANDQTSGDSTGALTLRNGDGWAAGRNVDFIKIDVEGFEAPALAGLRQTLRKNKPIIIMEYTAATVPLMEKYGGMEALLPYPCEFYWVCSPRCFLGIVETASYALQQTPTLVPAPRRYNALVVPAARKATIKDLLERAAV